MRRLHPGVSVFDVPGRGTALRDPAGRLVGVDLPPATVGTLTRWFDDPTAAPPDGLDDELAAFTAAGYLGRSAPAREATVAVAGTGPLADAVTAALDGPHIRTLRCDSVVPAGRPLPDAVVAVSDRPAPVRWSDLDVLPGLGVAWFRLAVEGRHGILEPPAVRAGDAGHAAVRARRLAAAGSGHPHLAAFWDAAPVTPTGPADHGLLAALCAADVRAWAGGHDTTAPGDLVPAALPARRRLRVVDLDSAAIADHALLPVPDSAP